MRDDRLRRTVRLLALTGLALSLVGCESIREAAGVTKEPPDEFAVVTKAPLVIPPDFNLKPPKPGAVPTNQSSPTDSAQAALYGDDPATIAASMPGTYSPEEKVILATSGAAVADHSIRKQLAADAKSMEVSDDDFTDKLLFGGSQPDTGKPVNAEAEVQRIGNAKAQGQQTLPASPAAGSSASPADDSSGDKKPDDSATIQKDDNGWLDGIF